MPSRFASLLGSPGAASIAQTKTVCIDRLHRVVVLSSSTLRESRQRLEGKATFVEHRIASYSTVTMFCQEGPSHPVHWESCSVWAQAIGVLLPISTLEFDFVVGVLRCFRLFRRTRATVSKRAQSWSQAPPIQFPFHCLLPNDLSSNMNMMTLSHLSHAAFRIGFRLDCLVAAL